MAKKFQTLEELVKDMTSQGQEETPDNTDGSVAEPADGNDQPVDVDAGDADNADLDGLEATEAPAAEVATEEESDAEPEDSTSEGADDLESWDDDADAAVETNEGEFNFSELASEIGIDTASSKDEFVEAVKARLKPLRKK